MLPTYLLIAICILMIVSQVLEIIADYKQQRDDDDENPDIPGW